MGHLLAVDEGTTSTRAVILDEDGRTVASAAREFTQSFPRPGWVEHDAAEIWSTTREVIGQALGRAQLTRADITAVGITNQRETTVLWERSTGRPVAPAIVWQDTRGGDLVSRLADSPDGARITEITGLPIASYFSAIKIMWLLESDPALRERAVAGELCAGTVDSWLIWNLTGGPRGGLHLTDVTNASRTLLMDLETLDWSADALRITGIPAGLLPEIRPSSGEFGEIAADQLLAGVPITGVLGDQQSAAFGQCGVAPGDVKNTYGTGCFILANTGEEIRRSTHGLITTTAFQIAGQRPQYALEGSIAVAGSLVQWLRDNLGLISSADEVEALARSVEDSGDVCFVPAFSGLFAPRWRPDARGVIVGLTRFATKAHIARAALESTAFQTAEVIAAMAEDSGERLTELRADGGMAANDLLMQFQADVLDCDVVRPSSLESTAAGAAFAAGIGCGVYSGVDDILRFRSEESRWHSTMGADERRSALARWDAAVERSLGWV